MKFQIIYINAHGRKEERFFQQCENSLDAINKLLNYRQVKRIISIKEIEPVKTLFKLDQ